METINQTAPLAEHEEMDRWKRLPVWAQQELEHWRRTEAFQRGRAENVEPHKESLELLFVCVQDIVDAWPKITMRTLGQMTARIDTLRQALKEVRKFHHGKNIR